MAYKIAFVNGKGGCGKTTSIFHVAGVLAKSGEKVLVIDFDKQRNITDLLLMNAVKDVEVTVLDVMRKSSLLGAGKGVYKAVWQSRGNAKSRYYGVDVMLADSRLDDEVLLAEIDKTAFFERLNAFIEKKKYTWVLADMPPSNRVVNEICFSGVVDFVIVPFTSDVFSVSGYGDLMETVGKAREVNAELKILGIFLSRYMANCEVDKYIRGQLLEFGDIFIDVQIPLRTDLREAAMFGRPISYYRLFSPGKTAYEELVGEMRKRIRASV